MKKGMIIAIAVLVAALIIAGVVFIIIKNNPNKPPVSEGASSIVGVWSCEKDNGIVKDRPEYWEFKEDGSYVNYQTNENGVVLNTIEGSYAVEGDKLKINYGGTELPEYTYKLTNADTLVIADHGTEETLTRFTGTLVK